MAAVPLTTCKQGHGSGPLSCSASLSERPGGPSSAMAAAAQRLTPDQSSAQLWQAYRWSIDPQQRREAALLMVATADHDLLRGQGWKNPLAAVALSCLQCGQPAQASGLWRELLQRFPNSLIGLGATALAEQQSDLSQQLLEQQPGHPAALTLATTMEPSASQGHRGPASGAMGRARARGASTPARSLQRHHTDSAEPTAASSLGGGLARLGRPPRPCRV